MDCDQPPPPNVDPGICCRISKPFDRLNFPDCFADVDETSTARNEIANRDDRNDRDDREDRNARGTDDDSIRSRNNGNDRDRLGNSDDNNRRSQRTDNRDSDSGEDERRGNRPNGKPRWGSGDWHRHGGGWHHGGHGDYHSFGAGGRYRHKRQLDRVVVRTSVRAQVTLGAGVGNGNVISRNELLPFSK